MSRMTTLQRIGVLGGTFNPIHHAHLFTAEEAANVLALDRVLLVPARRSPLKEPAQATEAQRLEMVRLAAAGNPLLEVSTEDVDRPPPSYTVDTMALLRERYPDAELVLILGVDALRDLLHWREPDRLLDQCQVFVVARPPHPLEVPAAIRAALGPRAGRIRLHDMPHLDISSTEIRRRLHDGQPVRYLLPIEVERYIRQYGLYQSGSTQADAAALCGAAGSCAAP